MFSKEKIAELLNDAEITGQKDLVKSGVISSILVKGNNIGFVIEAELAGSVQEAEQIKEKSEKNLGKIMPESKITAVVTANSNIRIGERAEKRKVPPPPTPSPIEGVKNVILVASGKGGVGKSTIAVNLAVSLGKLGFRVGIADADIYGPSVARMLGIKGEPAIENNQIIPPISHGIKCMSMGFILSEDAPVVWRGPMISKALYQLIRGANWGELDFLIIDMPPGTGDIHLSIAQNFNVMGAVIVTTPQDIALLDVKKCITMFGKVNIPVLGIIENMSYFEDPTSKQRTEIFGKGGGKKLAESFNIELLGEIALEPKITTLSDAGKAAAEDESIGKIFNLFAKKIADKVL